MQQLQSQAEASVSKLGDVDEFLDSDFASQLDAVLAQYNAIVSPVNTTLNSIQLDTWRAVLPVVVVDVVVGLLMLATVLAMCHVERRWFRFGTNYVLCPLMILICITCWLVAGLMVMGAGFMGDFCLPGGRGSSPDETILAFVNASGYGSTPGDLDSYTVTEYYVEQCANVSNPFAFLQESVPILVRSIVCLV